MASTVEAAEDSWPAGILASPYRTSPPQDAASTQRAKAKEMRLIIVRGPTTDLGFRMSAAGIHARSWHSVVHAALYAIVWLHFSALSQRPYAGEDSCVNEQRDGDYKDYCGEDQPSYSTHNLEPVSEYDIVKRRDQDHGHRDTEYRY